MTDVLRSQTKFEEFDEQTAEGITNDLEEKAKHEWKREVLARALELVRKRATPADFEAFTVVMLEGHSAAEAARFLGKSVFSVYCAVRRVTALTRGQVKLLHDRGY